MQFEVAPFCLLITLTFKHRRQCHWLRYVRNRNKVFICSHLNSRPLFLLSSSLPVLFLFLFPISFPSSSYINYSFLPPSYISFLFLSFCHFLFPLLHSSFLFLSFSYFLLSLFYSLLSFLFLSLPSVILPFPISYIFPFLSFHFFPSALF